MYVIAAFHCVFLFAGVLYDTVVTHPTPFRVQFHDQCGGAELTSSLPGFCWKRKIKIKRAARLEAHLAPLAPRPSPLAPRPSPLAPRPSPLAVRVFPFTFQSTRLLSSLSIYLHLSLDSVCVWAQWKQASRFLPLLSLAEMPVSAGIGLHKSTSAEAERREQNDGNRTTGTERREQNDGNRTTATERRQQNNGSPARFHFVMGAEASPSVPYQALVNFTFLQRYDDELAVTYNEVCIQVLVTTVNDVLTYLI